MSSSDNKNVHVRRYQRRRFGSLETVCAHVRRRPHRR